jgi:hypothetical protein
MYLLILGIVIEFRGRGWKLKVRVLIKIGINARGEWAILKLLL